MEAEWAGLVRSVVAAPDGMTVPKEAAERFAMDADDFGEVLGNLLDNARKWAISRIEIRVERDADGHVAITLAPGHLVGDLLGTCAHHLAIRSVRTERASLHDVYVATVSAARPPEAA